MREKEGCPGIRDGSPYVSEAAGMFRKAGLPSESTLCRVEKGIDDKRMAELQSDFARKMNPKKDKALFKLIAVDGK